MQMLTRTTIRLKGNAMSDENTPVEALEGASEALAADTGTDTSESTPEALEDVFSREYVQELREENKAARIAADVEKANLSEMLREFAAAYATAGILADPKDLPWSDDFEGEDGRPDLAAITAAAEELARRKPHLSRVRGSVGQGEHSLHEAGVSLSALLRG